VPAPAFQFNRQQLVNAVLEAALGDGLPSTQLAALAKDRKRPPVVIAAARSQGRLISPTRSGTSQGCSLFA
jgi:hypothetical protein